MGDRYEGDRALWAAVVAQARDDIAELPIGSTDYNAAVAFFTSPAAYWRHGRDEVGDHLGLTGETLRVAGTAWVIARRRKEGLPDHPPVPARTAKVEAPAPAPAPLVVPPDLASLLRVRHRREPRANPFHPAYRAA
jgi:hypothetical protein